MLKSAFVTGGLDNFIRTQPGEVHFINLLLNIILGLI